ncbi:M16 family metallopeptidase [Allorhizobium undicola]|uniref:M16 family metallopeptidase n=1 Tax=Allorhizobium undicola TaxID=78527 RepID=UPI0009FC108F|nr:pitrilysin family protein [Allorhizobium undicola]
MDRWTHRLGWGEGDVLMSSLSARGRTGMGSAGFLLLLCLLLCFPGRVAGAHETRWDPAIERGQLPNGLSYLIYDSGKPADPFNIRLIVHAGSVDEAEPSGLAHIMEHMVFQSTRKHPETLHRYFQKIGWRTGVEINAVTRETETQFMIRTRPNDALDLSGALDLMAEIAFGASLTPEDWAKERHVILEELRLTSGTAEQLNRKKKALLRVGSRYVDRPTIGTRQGIEKTTIEDIRAFRDRYYVASNMTLVISGRVDVAEVKSSIEVLFGNAAKAVRPDRSYTVLPLHDGLTAGTIQEAKGTTSQVTYALRLPMPEPGTEQGQKAWLEKYIIGQILRDEVRELAKACVTDVASLGFVVQEPTERRLILAFNARTADHDRAARLLLLTVERLRRKGISQRAFDTARRKAAAINRANIKVATSRTYADWEDKLTNAVLKGGTVEAPVPKAERTERLLAELDLASVNKRLKQMLSANDRVLIYQLAGNAAQKNPDVRVFERYRLRLASLKNLPPLPKPKNAVTKLSPRTPPQWPEFATPVQSGRITQEVKRDDPSIVEWSLSNGDHVVWLKKETAENKVHVLAQSRPGFRNSAFSSVISQAAIQLYDQSGFRFWTKEQYDIWQAHQKQRWDWTISESTLSATIVTAPDNLPEMLEIYAAKLRFGMIRQEAAVDFRSNLARQPANVSDEVDPYHVSSAPPETTIAEHITDQMLQDAAEGLTSAPVQWFVVGPAPDQITRDAFGQVIGAIQRNKTLDPAPRLQKRGSDWLEKPATQTGRAHVEISFFTEHGWSPESAFLVSALNPIARDALKNRLRLELGGIYSLAFDVQLEPDTNRAVGSLSFFCAPERATELAGEALKVLSAMPESVRTANITRLREDVEYAEESRRQDVASWMRRLSLSYRRYGDARYLASLPSLPDSITERNLTQAATEVFTMENHIVTLTGAREPFAQQGKEER